MFKIFYFNKISSCYFFLFLNSFKSLIEIFGFFHYEENSALYDGFVAQYLLHPYYVSFGYRHISDPSRLIFEHRSVILSDLSSARSYNYQELSLGIMYPDLLHRFYPAAQLRLKWRDISEHKSSLSYGLNVGFIYDVFSSTRLGLSVHNFFQNGLYLF